MGTEDWMQKSIGVPLQECIKIEDQEHAEGHEPKVKPINLLNLQPQLIVKKTVTPRDFLAPVDMVTDATKSASNIKDRGQSLKPPLSSRPPVRKTRSSVNNQVRANQERSARFRRGATKWSDKDNNPHLHEKDKA